MNKEQIAEAIRDLADQAKTLAIESSNLAATVASEMTETVAAQPAAASDNTIFWLLMAVFIMSGFVGYYVILKVTPALHSPLMSVSNAISGIVICGALLTTGYQVMSSSTWLGFVAIVLASINVFGGFVITHRMLSMFKKKDK